MVAVPTALAVTTPVALTSATARLSHSHVTVPPLASPYRVATSVSFWFLTKVTASPVMVSLLGQLRAMPDTVTVSFAVSASLSPALAVTVAVPALVLSEYDTV